MDADGPARARLRRPVRRLPVPDGAVVRARRRARAADLGRPPALARHAARARGAGASCGCSTRCSTGRAARRTSPRRCSSCSTRTSRSTRTARRSRCSPTPRCRGCCSRSTAACASRAAWRWPALFALVLTCTGGGVNAAVTGWVLLGPLLFVLYERFVGGVPRGAIRPFLAAPRAGRRARERLVARCRCSSTRATAWTSCRSPSSRGRSGRRRAITESLRLMGFWTSYIGLGFGGELRPYASHGAGPALPRGRSSSRRCSCPRWRSAGFAWTRRWRYGPWFLLLALVGLLVMVAGFPEGTPLRRALTFTYNHVEPVQFLRTTYKAGPLLALGLACLGGAAFGAGVGPRCGAVRSRVAGGGARAVARRGVAADDRARRPSASSTFDVPRTGSRPRDAVDRAARRTSARWCCPGSSSPTTTGAGRSTRSCRRSPTRPVAERMIVPFSDLRAVDLQFATRRARQPGARCCPASSRRCSTCSASARSSRPPTTTASRSGAVGAVEADDVLAREPAFAPRRRAARGAGRRRRAGTAPTARASSGRGAPSARRPAASAPTSALPRVTVRPVATGGMVRVLPRGPLTVVDGGAEGVAALAGVRRGSTAAQPLRVRRRPRRRARSASRARRGEVVVTDTNRRQAFVAARLRANRGRVLARRRRTLSEDGAMLDPFDDAARTRRPSRELTGVAVARGAVLAADARSSPSTGRSPRSTATRSTAWLADRALDPDRALDRGRARRAAREIGDDRRPAVQRRARRASTAIEVNGRRVAVRAGLEPHPRRPSGRDGRCASRIVDVSQPPGVTGGAGGISELRIPGVRAREIAAPAGARRAGARAADRSTAASRTCSRGRRPTRPAGPRRRSAPFQTLPAARPRRPRAAARPRRSPPPVARAWTARRVGRARPPRAPTPSSTASRGTTGTVARDVERARTGGLAAHRASRAFDGDAATAWVAPWVDRAAGPARPRAFGGARARARAPGDGAPPAARPLARHGAPADPRRRLGGRRPAGRRGRGADGRRRAAARPPRRPLRDRGPRGPRSRAGTSGRERQRRAVGIAEIAGHPGRARRRRARARSAAAAATPR